LRTKLALKIKLVSFEISQTSLLLAYISKRNDMSTIFLQQILSDKLLLAIIIGAKK